MRRHILAQRMQLFYAAGGMFIGACVMVTLVHLGLLR